MFAMCLVINCESGKMSIPLTCVLIVIICVKDSICEVHYDRPKIKSSDGDLILKPSYGKNLYLRTNGPGSSIFVDDTDVFKMNISKADAPIKYSDQIQVPPDVLKRLVAMESAMKSSPKYIASNITSLSRRISSLQSQINSLRRRSTDMARNKCFVKPCENGGTCISLAYGHNCMCPSNWEGQNCDIDVNECRNFAGTDLGCQNGATCVNRNGSYECLCRKGWYGIHCTRKIKDCSGGDFEMCAHGTCIPTSTGDGIKCICNQGWSSNNTSGACDIDINECETNHGPHCSANPKVNCTNMPGSFSCGACPPGYEGDGYICSDIDECDASTNGGCSTSPMVPCYNTVGSRMCGACPPGYQGDGTTCSWRGSCNINHGGCHPSAKCIENLSQGTMCMCPQEMDGDGFGIHGCYITSRSNSTFHCENNPCGAHGRCYPLPSAYTCICDKEYGGAHCQLPMDYCAGNPCHNGGTCKTDDSTVRGFRCECTAQFSGPVCQSVRQYCGGIVKNVEGDISYPDLNHTSYIYNSMCAWVIQTTADKVINVTFTKFDIEYNQDCANNFLQIHNGGNSGSQLIGRFCDSTKWPKGGHIISSHNKLYMWFHSSQSASRGGFALHWTSIDPVCGGEVAVASHGRIGSPGWPGKYPPNRDCYWYLYASPGKRLQLHFFQLDIEFHENCSYDYLAIYDGEHETDSILDKYCNSSQPGPLQSSGSELLIHFHSDAFSNGEGFQISYAAVEGTPGCGGLFTKDKGEITSPSLNGQYLNNLLCDYQIRAPKHAKIRIDIKRFNLEHSYKCKNDYVKVYDGGSTDAAFVGKFCVSYPKSYVSTSNVLKIQFKTDSSSTGEGFTILYEIICQQTVEADMGIVTSPGYPNHYAPSKVCEYIIKTTPGKAIQLMFQDFDIEAISNNTCAYDNIEIRDGIDANSTLLGRYCGGKEYIPPVTISTHNYMYIRFTSDQSYTGTGFLANFTTININCGGIYREPTGLINYPSESSNKDKRSRNCTWLLISPPGYGIKVTWNNFLVLASCSVSNVKVTEVDDNNQVNDVGVYCKNLHPPATLTVPTNRLNITLSTLYYFREGSGFSLSYAFIDINTHCGGVYARPTGVIYSPLWPKPYYTSPRHCIWTITVPFGQKIKLNISAFNLGYTLNINCLYTDYLIIRDGAHEDSPEIGKFCGQYIPHSIISLGNSLYLHFHSDAYYKGGSGFKIEWDASIYGCGGTLTRYKGTIASPNYPQPYSENAECFYKIAINPGSRIRIAFTDLDLERSEACKQDYVEIYDGRDSGSHSIGRYCYITSSSYNIHTSSNFAFIKFRSDFVINGKGFSLNYETLCQNNMTGSFGSIESPNYPYKDAVSLNCTWIISVSKGSRINVTFTDINIYIPKNYAFFEQRSHEKCHMNYVQITENENYNYTSKMCGNNIPPIFSSKSNTLIIKFVSNSYIRGSNFRLEWQSYGCGGYLMKNSGTIKYFNRFTNIDPLECEWVIQTSPGTGVIIYFIDVYMMESHNCTSDALEIYNGPNTRAPLATKVCHRGQSSYQSSSNFMLIKFVKNSDFRDVRFTATYKTTKVKCGGKINTLSGNIQSPNYPNNYDNNLNCIWYISVPQNHLIELNILDIDLYSSADNPYYDSGEMVCGDSIKIYNERSIYLRNFSEIICGHSGTKQIISKNNMLMIQFTTDISNTAKGFKASFFTTCGARIVVLYDGILTNDKLPYMSPNKSCIWSFIAANTEQKISFTFTHLSVPRNSNVISNRHCPSSYLRVYDGEDTEAPLVHEICGRKIPPMIVSQGSALTIEFGSYSGIALGQFAAHYTTIDTACGGTLTSEEGSLASPNYPNAYPDSSSCEWILSTSPGNQVFLNFEIFSIEDSIDCNQDYLEIRENNRAGRFLGVFCGNSMPLNTTIASKIYIKFRSDSKGSGQGFLAHYGFNHGGEIQGLNNGEITSPLYPHEYVGRAEYTWRIITKDAQPLVITILTLEIVGRGSQCFNYLSIYDGYDDSSPLLQTLCGLLDSQNKVLTTTSGAAFIKLYLDESNSGSIFRLLWSRDTSEPKTSENVINCGFNNTKMLSLGDAVKFESPNYGHGDYGDLSNCEWLFKTTPESHLEVSFSTLQLEQHVYCRSDYIGIYGSRTGGLDWTPIRKNICKSKDVLKTIVAETYNYMKINFITDSSISDKGFEGVVKSICGGVLEEPYGKIDINWDYWNKRTNLKTECSWQVKVRPGRTVSAQFLSFNISNDISYCSSYVKLFNGESKESPLIVKYCGYDYEDSNRTLITSGNALYVTYHSVKDIFQNFKIQYEENNIECGATSKLDMDHSWEVISSPNYPSVPMSFSECIWIFSGPPGEVLRIDFVDRFDLEPDENCSKESVDIRDGSSELSVPIGQYCHSLPTSVKSSNNFMFIKYITQIREPRNGFKANISIDVCGGTIKAMDGYLTSPSYPHMQILPPGIVCEWKLIGVRGTSLSITPVDISLPGSVMNCGTKVTVEESLSENESNNILKVYCNSGVNSLSTVDASTHKVSIKLTIGKPSPYSEMSNYKGFRFKFTTKHAMCGSEVVGSQGYITTPAYPVETSVSYCFWVITAQNASRSVRLELLDTSSNIQRIRVFEGRFYSHITNDLSNSMIYKTSGSQMSIVVSLMRNASKHRFKARFTTYDLSTCGEIKYGYRGELISPEIGQPFFCKWHYVSKRLVESPRNSNVTLFVTADLNTTLDTITNYCSSMGTKLSIGANVLNFIRDYCSSNQIALRIPSMEVDILAVQVKPNTLKFNISISEQPCGGVVHVGDEDQDILRLPSNYNGSLDCAWILRVHADSRIQITLRGIFTWDCSNEFLTISEKWYQSSYQMGHYCRDSLPSNEILTNFKSIYIQYHSNDYVNTTNIKLFAKIVNYTCGGFLQYDYENIMSPNYPNTYKENQECSWEISTDLGYRVTLQFVDRFGIENSPNCTNDAVIIQDWNNDEFTEIGRVCGRETPPNFNSSYNRMKIIFRTNSKINLDGFKATWKRICGGSYIATENEQFLYSPGYPTQYSPSLSCTYRITATNRRIQLQFLNFELEGAYPLCNNDNFTLEGTYGYHSSSYLYCDTKLPATVTEFNTINIYFRTDREVQKKGFKLSYNVFSCNVNVTEPTTIKLPTTNHALYCTWSIIAPIDKVVTVKLLYIDFHDAFDCSYDYIAAYNGLSIIPENRIALICGHKNSFSIIRSVNNTMLLNVDYNYYTLFTGFAAEVAFTYSQSVGCGGDVYLNKTSRVIKSPIFANKDVYDNFLDCQWTVIAPINEVIQVTFIKFNISTCGNVDQLTITNNCSCDYIEIRNGINPDSLIIGTYCGHILPPKVVTSGNYLSFRLYTDGEVVSDGFTLMLTSMKPECEQSYYNVTTTTQMITSPKFNTGNVARGLHCSYQIFNPDKIQLHLRINILDLLPGSLDNNECNKDRLVITNAKTTDSQYFGSNLTMRYESDSLLDNYMDYIDGFEHPEIYTFCGKHNSIDLYANDDLRLYLQTSPEDVSSKHKGFEIQIDSVSWCSRNYSGSQGRIKLVHGIDIESNSLSECFTLISAKDNYTISVYFSQIVIDFGDEYYIEFIDGKEANSHVIRNISKLTSNGHYPIFSTGSNLLIHLKMKNCRIDIDLNYVTTNKGQGCGGKIHNINGVITSPFYPDIYRRENSCEWELETPFGTKLNLHFTVFDLGTACDQNFVQLVDRRGDVYSTYCEEVPASYRSTDNYVKVVFKTTRNNGGTGWVAKFMAAGNR